MVINGAIHCFFEQSGAFKNEFRKLGYLAYDYDISNNYGETDFLIDLFVEIDNAYDGKPSVFDKITQDDLVLSFFPCIYFCATSQMNFSFTAWNHRNHTAKQKADYVIERSKKRERYFQLAVKMFSVIEQRGLRMIMENPWSEQTFLKANFIYQPTYVDKNRMLRGDYFVKPTAYWYVGCEQTYGITIQKDKKRRSILWNTRQNPVAGVCSEERSEISPDYARNFICDKIIGKPHQPKQASLFD